jgi:ABC-type nitrate/sulfonate/bicarbonate transport system substrate-binding protein
MAGAALRAPYAWSADNDLKVVVATSPPDPATHFFYYAQESGFFKDQGLNISVKEISSEATAVRALLAGEGDVALFVGGLSALQAWNAGAKIKCVSAFAPKLDYQIVAQESIRDIKSLSGQSFAISQAGTVSQIVAKLAIEQAGGESRNVRWVALGNSSSRVQGLIAKEVQGGLVNSSFGARLAKYNYLHVIGEIGTILPNFLYVWEIGLADTISRKQSQIQALVMGNARGVRMAYANPDKAVEISQKLLPDVTKDEVEFAVRNYVKRKYWNPDGLLPRETFDYTTSELVQRGEIKSAPQFGDFVISEFGDAVTKHLPPV